MHREKLIAIFWDNLKINFFSEKHRSSDLVNSSNIKYIFSSVGEGLPCKREEMFG